MTAQEIARLRELHAASTAGEWEPSHNVDMPKDDNWASDNDKREGRGEGPNHVGTFSEVREKATADAAFIAAAHNAMPALLDELEQARAERDALAAELAQVQEQFRQCNEAYYFER